MGRFRRAQKGLAIASAIAAVFIVGSFVTPITAFAGPTDPKIVNSNVGAVVDQTFSFSVAGLNSGACNGAAITGTGSSASAVSLGTVNKTSRAIGAQLLQIASNAGGGYTVFAHVDGPLSDGQGHTVASLGANSTNPIRFVDPGSEAFGYTTDSVLSGASPARFITSGPKWAGIDTHDREVMYGTTTTTSQSNCVAYQITIAPDTTGGFYGNNVTYNAVPTF